MLILSHELVNLVRILYIPILHFGKAKFVLTLRRLAFELVHERKLLRT